MSKVFYKSLGKRETWPDLTSVNPASLTYDDVLLVPQNSSIISRASVDTSVQFGPFRLEKPIIAAPMDTVSGDKMIRKLAELGAIGILPRGDIKERLTYCEIYTQEKIPCVYAVGLKNGMEEATMLIEKGAQMILVDVAHGGMERVKSLASEIKKKFQVSVIAGNIVSYEQAKEYKNHHIDWARVGVGPGGLCITRLVAGTGFSQLSAVFETVSSAIPVIADGGIKTPGHFAKAIAAGAKMAMIGSLFAGTDETPGKVEKGFKVARGQASAEYMKDNGVETGEFRTAEGISIKVPAKGPVENVINDLMGGLRSAMTYTGAESIEDFQKKAEFAVVSQSGREESKPWLKDYSSKA